MATKTRGALWYHPEFGAVLHDKDFSPDSDDDGWERIDNKEDLLRHLLNGSSYSGEEICDLICADDSEYPPDPVNSWIYFVQVSDTTVKIGSATFKPPLGTGVGAINTRLAECRRWGVKPKMIGLINGTPEAERLIHQILKDHKADGGIGKEVFNLSERVTAFIDEWCEWTPDQSICDEWESFVDGSWFDDEDE